MNFKITLEIDNDAQSKVKDIINLSDSIQSFLINKYYGSDLKEILIALICIKTKKGYENWYKIRKPKYTDYKKKVNKLTGVVIEIEKSFSFDCKIDNELYEEFIKSDVIKGEKILIDKIIDSLSNLDFLPKSVKDFNKDNFKEELIEYLNKNYL